MKNSQFQEQIIKDIDVLEDGAVRSLQIRDDLNRRATGLGLTTKEHIVLCNIVWSLCTIMSHLLKHILKGEKK